MNVEMFSEIITVFIPERWRDFSHGGMEAIIFGNLSIGSFACLIE